MFICLTTRRDRNKCHHSHKWWTHWFMTLFVVVAVHNWNARFTWTVEQTQTRFVKIKRSRLLDSKRYMSKNIRVLKREITTLTWKSCPKTHVYFQVDCPVYMKIVIDHKSIISLFSQYGICVIIAISHYLLSTDLKLYQKKIR